jgi:hypothetical protein
MNDDKICIATTTKQQQPLAYIKLKKASLYFYVDVVLKLKLTHSNRGIYVLCNIKITNSLPLLTQWK